MSAAQVFLSVAGPDRDEVRRLKQALEKVGLTVFLDETGILPFAPITASIVDELARTTLLVAYYSVDYADRPACQRELILTFLAGQREGDGAAHIAVINPEDDHRHLAPVELRDRVFARLPRRASPARMNELALRIREHVQTLQPIPVGPSPVEPKWIGPRIRGAHAFTGRYRTLWQLHSALHHRDFGLIGGPTLGPVAAVAGPSGIGKTSLVAAYGVLFGSAFPGGVYWTTLAGTDEETLQDRYTEQLRQIADRLHQPVAALPVGSLRDRITDAIGAGGDCLWVIDDVPADLDLTQLPSLVPDHRSQIRTVLITRSGSLRGQIPVLEMHPLTIAEGSAVLQRFRPIEDQDDEERAACARIVQAVGGHPLALNLLGPRLDSTGPLTSYRRLEQSLPQHSTLDPVTAVLAQALAELPAPARNVLRVAAVCAPVPVPAGLFGRTLSTAGVVPLGAAGDAVVIDALQVLRDRQLAVPVSPGTGDDSWLVHALVAQSARSSAPEPAGDPSEKALALAMSAVLLEITGRAGLDERIWSAYVPHAEALVRRTDLDPGQAEALLRRLCHWYAAAGTPSLAARAWEKLCALTGSADDQVSTARAQVDAGEHERAVVLADAVLAATPHGPLTALTRAAELVRVQALDALTRYDEAEPGWQLLLAGGHVDPDLRLARVQALRLRGKTAPALADVGPLIGDAEAQVGSAPAQVSPVAEQLQSARIELARLQLETDAQGSARTTAAAVVAYYARTGRPQHARAQEAREVEAEAWATLFLTELKPDPQQWTRAEQDLARAVEENREAFGRNNPITLTTAVAHGQALVSCGRPTEARTELTAVRDRVAARLGQGSRLWFRATFYLGQATGQLHEYETAIDLYRQAFDGQLALLGRRHAETLHSQYGLGVGLMLTGRRAEGLRHLAEVRRLVPGSVGRATDLYAQSMAATALGLLPSGLWRWIDRRTGHSEP